MRTKERNRLQRSYGRLYRPHYSEQGLCFYCGAPAACRDHVPPISWVESASIDGWRRSGVLLVTVLSCLDCNRLLGDKPLFTARDRAAFMERRLSEKYERAVALWSESEIAEMSKEFQRTIRARKAALVELHNRIRYVQQRIVKEWTFPTAVDV